MLVCIVVTFHPELPILARQFEALPDNAALIIVDNASGHDIHRGLRNLTSTRKRTHLIINDHNIGLASAINQGAREACLIWKNVRFALFLDQDSIPCQGSIATLLESFFLLQMAHNNLGCVGPALLDTTTGLYHGFHQQNWWRWKRIYPNPGDTTPVRCANLNGSGTLVPIKLFLELTGLDEDFFIDHVDTEWAFRIQAAGYELYGIPNAIFEHRMGDTSRRIWLFGWSNWPMRSPQRHYFLFRNATLLIYRNYVPLVWKFWAIAKLLLTVGIHILVDSQKKEQLRNMRRGLSQGFKIQRSIRKNSLLQNLRLRNKN